MNIIYPAASQIDQWFFSPGLITETLKSVLPSHSIRVEDFHLPFLFTFFPVYFSTNLIFDNCEVCTQKCHRPSHPLIQQHQHDNRSVSSNFIVVGPRLLYEIKFFLAFRLYFMVVVSSVVLCNIVNTEQIQKVNMSIKSKKVKYFHFTLYLL